MIERICECCGKIFRTYPSIKRKYCSKNCSMKKRWESKEKGKRVKIICQYCGKEFELLACESRVKKGLVHYCSKECRDNARKNGKYISCQYCGKEFYSIRNHFCSKECANNYRSEYCVKKTYKENGYIIHHIRGYNKKGNAKEHRLVMENYLGRKLGKDEVVHHIDGNRENNNIENLVLMTRGEHSRHHRQEELKSGKILFKTIKEL